MENAQHSQRRVEKIQREDGCEGSGPAVEATVGRERLITTRLYRGIPPVTDIERAAEFYGIVLGHPGERVSPGRHYFNCAGTILACYDPSADGDPVDGGWRFHRNQFVYFAAGDLEALLERAKAAGCKHIDDTISFMPWGERLF